MKRVKKILDTDSLWTAAAAAATAAAVKRHVRAQRSTFRRVVLPDDLQRNNDAGYFHIIDLGPNVKAAAAAAAAVWLHRNEHILVPNSEILGGGLRDFPCKCRLKDSDIVKTWEEEEEEAKSISSSSSSPASSSS